MSERTLIVSGANLLARGYLTVPTDRRAPGGEPVNALFAVTRALQRVIAFKVPARAVAVIDAAAEERGLPPILAQQLPALTPSSSCTGSTSSARRTKRTWWPPTRRRRSTPATT